jgi:autotransporter-associated beta strand protein
LSSVINVNQSNNVFFSGSFAGFNGTINLNTGPGTPATGDEVIFDGVGTAASLTAGTVINVATGQTCAIAVSPAPTVSATIILNGPGNTGKYGALRIDNGNLTGNLILAGTNNWVGSDQGTLTISGIISDSGTGNGIVLTSGNAGRDFIIFEGANTYTGVTTISNGSLRVASVENPGVSGPLGTSTTNGSISFPGSSTANYGALQYSSANNYDYSARFSAAASQVYIVDVDGQPVTFASPLTSAGGTFTLYDAAGGGTLTLNAANTYSGGTTINSGTLNASVSGAVPGNVTVNNNCTLDASAAGSIVGNVTISNNATINVSNAAALSQYAVLTLPSTPVAGSVNLNFTGTQTVSALYFGPAPQATGTWGAVGSSAANTSSAFTGTGILNVAVPAFANSYWDPGTLEASPGSGGIGTWNSTQANWWEGGSSDSTWAANVATFAGSAGTVTLSANEVAQGLAFTTTGYTITNSSSAVLTLVGAPTVSVAGGIATIGCPVCRDSRVDGKRFWHTRLKRGQHLYGRDGD